jgi:hypothetical protein
MSESPGPHSSQSSWPAWSRAIVVSAMLGSVPVALVRTAQLPDAPGRAELQRVCGTCRGGAVRLASSDRRRMADRHRRHEDARRSWHRRRVRGRSRNLTEHFRRSRPAPQHQQSEQCRPRERRRTDSEKRRRSAPGPRNPVQETRRPRQVLGSTTRRSKSAKSFSSFLNRSRFACTSNRNRYDLSAMPSARTRSRTVWDRFAAWRGSGMGEVYRARDTRLNRRVAIKVLPEAHAADASSGQVRGVSQGHRRAESPHICTDDVGRTKAATTS